MSTTARPARWFRSICRAFEALNWLADQGCIDGKRILGRVPHADGANIEPIKFFLGRIRPGVGSAKCGEAKLTGRRQRLMLSLVGRLTRGGRHDIWCGQASQLSVVPASRSYPVIACQSGFAATRTRLNGTAGEGVAGLCAESLPQPAGTQQQQQIPHVRAPLLRLQRLLAHGRVRRQRIHHSAHDLFGQVGRVGELFLWSENLQQSIHPMGRT